MLISYLDGVRVSIVTGRLLHGLTYFCESASFETCHSIFTVFCLRSEGKNLESFEMHYSRWLEKILFCFSEGVHPVVYRQLFIVLVPSIHNKYKDQMY